MYRLAPASLPTSAAASTPRSTQKLITVKWKLQQKALLDNQLTKADVLVLNFLLEKFNRTYENTLVGYVRMAEALGLGLRTAKKAVQKLIARGYLCKSYQGGRTKPGGRKLANIYSFRFDQVTDWTPGWCDPKERALSGGSETVHGYTPLIVQTVHRSAPFAGETVHGYAPLPIFLKTPIYQETTTPRPNHQGDDRCCRHSSPSQKEISSDEQEYIELEVDRAEKAGEIRKSPGAYRVGLQKKALAGELDISELENLRRQKKAEELANVALDLSEAQAKEKIQQAMSGQDVTVGHIHLTPAEALQKLSNSFPTAYGRVQEDRQASQHQETETTESHIQALVDAGHQPQKICESYVWERLNLGPSNVVDKILSAKFPEIFSQTRKIRELYRQCLMHREGAKNGNSFLQTRLDQKLDQLQALAPDLAQQIAS
ncbi:MAG: hypothetical protein K9K79_06570 [Desulfohalobiaceae bacterium]|nr:hypothetical protein [Desulfohalobiaceae bacterium]